MTKVSWRIQKDGESNYYQRIEDVVDKVRNFDNVEASNNNLGPVKVQ